MSTGNGKSPLRLFLDDKGKGKSKDGSTWIWVENGDNSFWFVGHPVPQGKEGGKSKEVNGKEGKCVAEF